MQTREGYRFSSLASRVREGIDFLDRKFPVGVWCLGITDYDLKHLDMSSSTKDVLSIVYGKIFAEVTFDLEISGGETWLLGFTPYKNDPIESWKLDRIWKYAIKKCQKRTLKNYGLLSE